MSARKKIAVLISGSGSNLQALIDACAQPDFPAEITLVISNKAEAFGLTRAQQAGIATEVVSHKEHKDRAAYDRKIDEILSRYKVEYVCLAGFMRLLSEGFVTKWYGRMINIHPSLLPSFKGAHAHVDAIAAGVKISGCTVHFVSPQMDAGPIIAQASVPVLPGDTAETLGARVLEQEHRLYPQALKLLAGGHLLIDGQQVHIHAH